MWVHGDGGADDASNPGVPVCGTGAGTAGVLNNCGGLHYDSCNEETATRYAGVIPNFFTTENEWVQVAWVKVSRPATVYNFYRNEVLIADGSGQTDIPAPAEVQLSDSFNIGHNDNYFYGAISEVAFYDFAISAVDVFNMYSGTRDSHLSIGDNATEIWIGYSDRDTEAFCNGESGFIWTDATATHYNAWSDGEPSKFPAQSTSCLRCLVFVDRMLAMTDDWLCTSNGQVQNGADQNGAGQICGSDCETGGNGDMVTDDTTQHEDCVALLKSRAWGWNDYHCDLHLQFVCGFCSPTCAPTSYNYYDTPMTWANAEDYCVEQGGHLASMHSADDVRTVGQIATARGATTNVTSHAINL